MSSTTRIQRGRTCCCMSGHLVLTLRDNGIRSILVTPQHFPGARGVRQSSGLRAVAPRPGTDNPGRGDCGLPHIARARPMPGKIPKAPTGSPANSAPIAASRPPKTRLSARAHSTNRPSRVRTTQLRELSCRRRTSGTRIASQGPIDPGVADRDGRAHCGVTAQHTPPESRWRRRGRGSSMSDAWATNGPLRTANAVHPGPTKSARMPQCPPAGATTPSCWSCRH
jgi:hypothetical protein